MVAQAHIPRLTPIEQGQLDPQLGVDLLAGTVLDAEGLLFNGALLGAILRVLDLADRPQGYGYRVAGR